MNQRKTTFRQLRARLKLTVTAGANMTSGAAKTWMLFVSTVDNFAY
jgi:hypothetical protein